MSGIPLSWVGIPLLFVFLNNPVAFTQGFSDGIEPDKTHYRGYP